MMNGHNSGMASRTRLGWVVCGLAAVFAGNRAGLAEAQPEVPIVLENECAKYVIAANGQNLHFIDRRTGTDYCAASAKSCFARVTKGGKEHKPAAVSYADGRLTATFDSAGVTAVIKATIEKRYFVFEVVSVRGADVERLRLLDLAFKLKGTFEEPFAACAVALNLKTKVQGLPGLMRLARAECFPRFGFTGAEVALVGCPTGELRDVLQEVVSAAPDLPHSSIGGPWALDAPINRGSYLFNFGGLSEETVDEWIRLAQRLGITQIDFHGGRSFRFGDCRPNPKTYPKGRASFKAVIDKLHAAGIAAGLHTYAQFIDKRCPWVTPVPDPRLGKDATFTLAEALTSESVVVPVVESTENMSAITGSFVRNSVTLHVDDELITYSGVSKEPPYAFTGCKRGACGTGVAPHAKGAKAHHLRECFGRFVPDGDSTLYAEVAAKTAEMFNECGFDMMYLDALDGSDAVAGRQYSWHYAAKFVFEIWKRLERPALTEASTFPHHLWFVRSRAGAWDHPVRSHKKFIDVHCGANENYRRRFLPTHLGWWAFKTWGGAQTEPTFADDIEYLCGKCIGNGCGLSIMGINPSNVSNIPALPRLATIMRRYENLRHANYFTDAVKEKLRVPGDEYTLTQSPEGEWQFRAVQYDKHKVEGLDGWSNVWKATNKFGRQSMQLRIEALMSAKAYDTPGAVTVADFTDPKDFPSRSAARGIDANIEASMDHAKVGRVSGRYTAASKMTTRRRAWSRAGKKFSPPINLGGHQALGVWIHGDGLGEVLNFQLRHPTNIYRSICEHYAIIDFTGWRYFEFVEPEGRRYGDYSWPYGSIYSIYRAHLRYSQVETLSLWYNNLPPGRTVSCYLSPIRALPTVKAKLRKPTVTVRGRTIRFPVEIESGCRLEFRSPTDCKLYGPTGDRIADVKPEGDVPVLEPGENEIQFTCESDGAVSPRAYVSVIGEGGILRGRNPSERIKWDFLRREQDEPRVIEALDGTQNEWDVTCVSGAKQVDLEVEIAVGRVGAPGDAYDAPGAITLEAFDNLDAFKDGPDNKYLQYVVSGSRRGFPTSVGVTHRLDLCPDVAKVGKTSVRYTATSANARGWSARGKRFSPPVDLSSCTDIGFWLHGDAAGEILYLQLRDTNGACHDMKTRIDFTGWKYVEFGLAGAALQLAKIEYLIIYYNAIPGGKTVTCCIDDVRGLRAMSCLTNPSIALGGRKLVFPVSLSAGDRLVYRSGAGCEVSSPGADAPKRVRPQGKAPVLRGGRNRLRLELGDRAAKTFQLTVHVTKVYR